MLTADPGSRRPLARAARKLVIAAALAAAACSSPDGPPGAAAGGRSAGSGAPGSPPAADTGQTAARDPAGPDSASDPARTAAPSATGARLASIAAKLDTTSTRIDGIAARLDTVQRNVGGASRNLSGLRRDMRNGKLFAILVFLLGVLAGALGLPRLTAWWRTYRGEHHSPPESDTPPVPTLSPEAQRRVDRKRAAAEAQAEAERARIRTAPPPGNPPQQDRQTAEGLASRIATMEAALNDAVQTLSDELRQVRDELHVRQDPNRHGGAGGRVDHTRTGERGHNERGRDFVARPSEYRDLSAGGADQGGAGERIQVLLNEEGIFVPYPEPVSKPMAEIRWHPGHAEADAVILTSFLFSLDSRRLQIAFEVDNLDSGRYETLRPARVHWTGGLRGQVIDRGRLRYVGT